MGVLDALRRVNDISYLRWCIVLERIDSVAMFSWSQGLPAQRSSRDHARVTERRCMVRPDPAEPCAWCGRRRSAPLPLKPSASPAGGSDRSLPTPVEICDVCAGLLGLTPYDPHLDGPHARTDAFDAVRLLTRAEPLVPTRARRRCTWCSRPARAGWCPTCARLLDIAAHAAGATLLTALPADDVAAACREVAVSCATRAA